MARRRRQQFGRELVVVSLYIELETMNGVLVVGVVAYKIGVVFHGMPEY